MSFIYNVHTHIFNLKCVPDRFLGLFIPERLGKWLLKIIDHPKGQKWVIKLLTGFRKNPFVEKYLNFLTYGTQASQQGVFKKLMELYPEGTKFVVLTLNMDLMGAGTSSMKYKGQIDDILSVRRLYPNTCLPFLSIDPRMEGTPGLLEFVKEYMRLGFVGLKMYPSLGFYPFDPRLEPVFRFAEENQIPVMTHCTRTGVYYKGEITSDMTNPANMCSDPPSVPGNFKPTLFPVKIAKHETFCDYFLDPLAYNFVLAKYPKLKICFAHYGGSKEMEQNLQHPEKDTWYTRIRYLMKTYENVYADISYTLADKNIFPLLKADLEDPFFSNRILFGTDFFMTEQEKHEKKLAVEFRDFISRDIPAGFKKIAYDNSKRYLSSSYYIAP